MNMKLGRLKKYFRANPGTLFILAFQVLLVAAAVLLVVGNSSTANEVAIYSFYAVVAGVAIQIGVSVWEERKRTRTGNGNQNQSS